MDDSQSIVTALRRDLNCLADSDRSTRRRALERLQKQLLQGEINHSSTYVADLQVAWDDTILKNILKALNDSVEKCRELSILIINGVVCRIQQVDETVALVIPLIAQRMGHLPLIESSEEIRLQMMNFICSGCIKRCSENTLKLVAQELTQVLCISLGDQFHEIKKGASRAIVMLMEHSNGIFSEMLEELLRALLPNIGHTHSKVRIATLEAINSVVLCGLPAGMVAELLVPSIKALALDRTIGVRELFFAYIAGWLGYAFDINDTGNRQCLNDALDPRTYAPQLLPLLLLGLSDESTDVAEKTLHLVEGVGELYMKFQCSGETDIGKMVNKEAFGTRIESCIDSADVLAGNHQMEECAGSHPQHGSVGFELPPPYKGRPGKGCCMMVQACLGELINPVQKDLIQWTSNVRLGAARILYALLILGEEKVVEYLDTLVPCLCSAVSDDDIAVAQHAINALHVLGCHVLPDYWLALVLDQVITSQMSQAQVANGLLVLAGLLYGTPSHAVKESTVMKVTKQLYGANLGFSDYPAIRQQLLAVLENLIEKGGVLCQSSSLEISLLLLQLQCLEGDSKTHQLAITMVNNFARVIGLNSGKDLYAKHMESIIGVIISGYSEWTGTSSGAFLFQTFLESAGSCVGCYLETLLPVFTDCLNAERDPVLRLRILPLLDKLFEMDELGIWWQPLALHIIGGILLPCSAWHIGKVAAEIRHAAMAALGTFLGRDLCRQENLGTLLHSQQLLSIVTFCLEEDYYTDTRRVSCNVIEHILRIVGFEFNDEQIVTASKSLLKRLDDSNDTVRLAILPAISEFLIVASLPNRNFDIKGFLSNLILHMEDLNEKIQVLNGDMTHLIEEVDQPSHLKDSSGVSSKSMKECTK
ncbi:uncharacterized protein LOC131063777 isoform X2 [Cryptomeria japonica]|uniref:uncharacterized protein LOC131063777 isoform X2 n=1 Tax=Cryptomeria japonica TaxID=3369 RepID=UPI0027DA4193|nr:uncharacterized protein LOC131063777 isoform X2 [Cryptomeria japonica]